MSGKRYGQGSALGRGVRNPNAPDRDAGRARDYSRYRAKKELGTTKTEIRAT